MTQIEKKLLIALYLAVSFLLFMKGMLRARRIFIQLALPFEANYYCYLIF